MWGRLGAEIEHDSKDTEQEDGDEQGNQRALAHEPLRLCGRERRRCAAEGLKRAEVWVRRNRGHGCHATSPARTARVFCWGR